MGECICKEALIKALEADINTNWADYPSEDYIDGVRDEYDDVLEIICQQPAADVQPVDRWISVKDRLPEVGQPVVIYYPYWTGLEVQVARLEYDKLTFDICGEFNASVNKVTHWQPLPEPPKATKG